VRVHAVAVGGEEVSVRIIQGDCLDVLRTLPDASIDSCVTDPPYGIRFMGKAWDGADIEKQVKQRRSSGSDALGAGPNGGHNSAAIWAGRYNRSTAANVTFQIWTEDWSREVLRVLRPGGHLLCFASTRTYHRMACGIEDAGFEIRDQIGWAFGSGFPKSHNGPWGGTALKPAWEPIVMARKPIIGTVAVNVQQFGTGGLNIDACRIGVEERTYNGSGAQPHKLNAHGPGDTGIGYMDGGGKDLKFTATGRWPANLILTYPEDEYELRDDVTPEQLRQLAGWMDAH